MEEDKNLEDLLSRASRLSSVVAIKKGYRLDRLRENQPGKVLERKAVYFGRPGHTELDYYIILVKLGNEDWGTQYVTWAESAEDGSRYWGHYFTEDELPEAQEDFEARG